MHTYSNSGKRRGVAAIAVAAAASLSSASFALAQTPVTFTTSTEYQYETGNDTYSPASHFYLYGSTYKYADWGLLQFTPTLPQGTNVNSVGPNVTLDMYNYAATYNTKKDVTLTFYMSTDTATNVAGTTLFYKTGNNSQSQPIVGGFDTIPADTGTFGQAGIGTPGSQIVEVGTYTYNATNLTDQQELPISLQLNSQLESYVQSQMNNAAPINIIVSSSETDSNQASFYTGSTGATAPGLTFQSVGTTTVQSNGSLLYGGAYSPTNTSKTAYANVGKLINGTWYVLAGYTTNTTTQLVGGVYQTVPAEAVVSNGSTNSNDTLTYSVTDNGAYGTPAGPIAPGGSSYVSLGFTPSDTTISQGGTPAIGSVSLSNLSNYKNDLTPVVVNINTNDNSLAVNQRYVDSAEGAAGNGAATPNFNKVLVKANGSATYSMPINITTANPVAGDYSSDALTTETLNGNATASTYSFTDSFWNSGTTDPVVAILGANTNGIAAKTFDSTETGTVNGTLTPMISGTFGNYVSQTESTFTSTNAPEHATFYGAAQGATAITGMDLQGEDDSMYVYMQWQGYQAASVTPNTGVASVGGTVTLTNAPSNDNIFTPTDGTGPFNNGLRADAWVSAITPNQTWTGGGGWSFSNFAADTLNSTTTTNGTVIAGGGSPVSATVNFTPSAQMLTGTYGATISVGLENEQDIQGTSNNDLTPVAFIVQGGTVNNGAGPQAGNYSLNGGTLSAPATTLSGMYTQTGGQATFVSLVDTGTAVISGGTLTIGSLSINGGLLKLSSSVSGGSGPAVTSTINLSSVSITGSGQLDVYNNHVIITYGASDPFSTIAGYIKSGYNNGAWNGPGIISTAAQIKTNGLSYGVGYADGKDGVVSGLVSGQIEVAYTLLGDANLDGLVNAADFSILAANFNQTVTGWDQGDFNYDGIVNAADFTDLAANFNQPDSGAASAGDVAALDAFAAANGLSLPTSSVPEPASGALALFGVGMLARRARRRDDR